MMTPLPTEALTSSNLVDLLRRRAAAQPDRTAYIYLEGGEVESARLTYGELEQRVLALAAKLAALGARGERVLLVYPPGLDYLTAFFACLAAGAVAVPVYPPRPNRPMPRILAIQANARARFALTTPAVLDRLDPEQRALTGAEWLAPEVSIAEAEDWRDPGIAPADLAFLQYTSGSTAAPKGVCLAHHHLLANLRQIHRAFAQSADDRGVIWLPPYHDMGLIGGLLQPLYAGYPMAMMAPVDFLQKPLRWLRAISSSRATVSGAPNFAYDLCVRKATESDLAELDLSSWRVAFNGAEPVRAESLRAFAAKFAPCGFDAKAFLPCYGLAEGTLLVSAGRTGEGFVAESFAPAALEAHRAERAAEGGRELVSSGQAAEEIEILVVDPQSLAEKEDGEVGEIWVKSPSVAGGYFENEEASKAAFGATTAGGRGPFLRTGDLGFLAGGELFVTGREKDLIIVRGRNLYPQDLEATVEACHPALQSAGTAAFSVEEGGEERLVLVAEVERTQRRADPEKIVDAIRRAIAEDHEAQVHALVLIRPATLPKTSSGKVQRHAARRQYLAGELQKVADWHQPEIAEKTDQLERPLTKPAEIADWLAGQMRAKTGMPVSADTPLADCPLDSLQVVEVRHAIEDQMGVELPMERFFSEATLLELAGEIAELAAKLPEVTGELELTRTLQVWTKEGPVELPLSAGQRSLFFLHQLDPKSAAYNVPIAARLRGPLDVAALRRAFQWLTDRHEILRTTFITPRGEARQIVQSQATVAFEEIDGQGLSEGQLLERLKEDARRPFDLQRGPLLRVVCYRRSALDATLFLSLHHIITDLRSLAVLLDELAVAYPAFREGREPLLGPPPPPYREVVFWQKSHLESEAGELSWQYWKERLSGELPTIQLQTDRPRPRRLIPEGRSIPIRLGRGLSSHIGELAQQTRSTPFMVLLAIFEVLLHRYTGQDDLLIGTVAAARRRSEHARTQGYFVNPLVLRAELEGNPTFLELLARTRRDVLGAFEHQDFPFPTLVERLQPNREPGRSPLFDVLFVLQKASLGDGQDLTAFGLGQSRGAVQLGGLRLEPIELDLGLAQFDLTLTLGEVEGAYYGSFDYNAQLFDEASIARMAGHFQRLADSVIETPGQQISLLRLIGLEEERRLLVEWNDTSFPLRRDATLADLFEEQAAKTPDAVALFVGGERRTYLELNRRASQLARHLQRHLETLQGPGDTSAEKVIAICLDRSAPLIVSILAVLKAGAAYLPLDSGHPPERLQHTLARAGAILLVTKQEFLPLFGDHGPEAILIDGDLEEIAVESGENPPRLVRAENLACVIYTSGSTGEPKGVLLEHRSLVNMVTSFKASYHPEHNDRILPLTAIASASFVGEILPLLCTGGALVLSSEEEMLDAAALVRLIEKRSVSIVSTVPSIMANLNALRDRLPKLRLILVGGEALSAGDVDKLIGAVEIVNGYGLTETAICSTYYHLTRQDLDLGRRPPIGKPVINTRLYVLDEELRPQPIGRPGEIYIGGEGLARGYLSAPARSAERFLPDPFEPGSRLYRSGDLGAWLPDGNLIYLGRVDRQVSLRGFRIELQEIESVLALHRDVVKVVVILREDRPGQKRLVAYAVPEEGSAPTQGELLAYSNERLPDYMVPSVIVFLDTLPLHRSGKVNLAGLPEPAQDRPELEAAYLAPKSELERQIALIWQEHLAIENVGLDDNFFDLGGHSLMMSKVHADLKETLEREIALVELFQYPTVGTLARFLAGGAEPAASIDSPATPRRRPPSSSSREVAIVGLAGRFPGANNPRALWANIEASREAITFFSPEEMLAAGVSPELLANPNYVRAKGILGDVDLFDAELFGLNPREVELMDPQHRLFLECCYEAIEDAGYDPERYAGLFGVYGGESMNTYLLTNLLPHMELVASADTLQAALGNDKDPLTSRVAYKLDLKGPSVTVQTASSTSLAAVHVAVKSLLQGDCDMALAGGVSIHLPEVTGYMYQEGGTTARDGHCRAFDADGTGFVSGHGCGIVVLKRLEDALADGDHIRAVIKGSACNNDGSLKVSFMAPSVDGQVAVYRRAYEDAGISPQSLSYVECHGTATAMGDPIEITALSQVFREHTREKTYCAIGSLKTNIGHLDTAAGVCGLIKTALSLENEKIPASLHFKNPNPRIDFASSPFFVNTALRAWPRSDTPRRAGVTSLGMGGTNVHVVLEEAPLRPSSGPSRPWQMLFLSAKTAAALEERSRQLADFLAEHPQVPLADIAYTLQVGRKNLGHKRLVLCRDSAALEAGEAGEGKSGHQDALEVLRGGDPARLLTTALPPGDRPLAFLFSGQGAQYAGMAQGVYESEPSFRADIDRCAEILVPFLGWDLRTALFPPPEGAQAANEKLLQTEFTQPALFAITWSMARLFMRWGARPQAMIGHSLGEYVAACLAGVFKLEDALLLVALRGRLMQQMPEGAMLAVPLREEEVLPLLGDQLSLSVVNKLDVCVVGGPSELIEDLERMLEERGIGPCRRLHTSHAYHSQMMEPILRSFVEEVKKIRLEPPVIPYISNVTGRWIRPEEATDPEYWARHLRQTVRFAEGVGKLLEESRRVLIEVGPGNNLATLVQQHPARGKDHVVLSAIRHPKEKDNDHAYLLRAFGRLYLAGLKLDWQAFYQGEDRRRVPLPTYPFERRSYWVDPPKPGERAKKKGARLKEEEFLFLPGWRKAESLPALSSHAAERWLILGGDSGETGESVGTLGAALAEQLRGAGELVEVTATPARDVAGWEALLEEKACRRLLYLLPNQTSLAPSAETGIEEGFWPLFELLQSAAKRSQELEVIAISRGLWPITGEESGSPFQALAAGPLGVAWREAPQLSCRQIDLPEGGDDQLWATRLLPELLIGQGPERGPAPRRVAWRGRSRFLPAAEPRPSGAEPALREQGVWLITGGLGGIGIEIAEELAARCRARLVLLSRSAFPPQEEWNDWLGMMGEDEPTSKKIRRLEKVLARGAELLVVQADVADAASLQSAREKAEKRFGRIDAVLHAAGVAGGGLLRGRTRREVMAVLKPKVQGTLNLADVFAGAHLDAFIVTSSITAVLPQIGQLDYVAANAFLDAFAHQEARRGELARKVISINWDAWKEVGMAVGTEVPAELKAWRAQELERGLSNAEGVKAFLRALEAAEPQVVVSTTDLAERLVDNAKSKSLAELEEEMAPAQGTQHERPDLLIDFAAPVGELEEKIAAIWREILGIDKIGRHDNFFDLGGNSLAGIRITGRIKDRLAVSISDVSLYEAPTVATLKALIAAANPQAAGAADAGGAGAGDMPATTAREESRNRGERRKQKLLQKRGLEAADGSGDTEPGEKS